MSALFFYGSLRDRELIDIVLGRPVDPAKIEPATARDYAAIRLASEAYPALVRSPGARADGLLLRDIRDRDLERLAFFEEAEYGLAPITVHTANGPREARYYRGTDKPRLSGEAWDFAAWRREHRAVAVEVAREYMDHMGRIPVEEIDSVWPGIKIRAQQRARALATPPAQSDVRTNFGQEDVRQLGLVRAHTGFLAVQEFTIDHRRFDGGWTGRLDRTAVVWGDAVTVLPYDPRRDRVLLIEQFRPGPLARGDQRPWCLEVIAGRLDAAETAEQVARREAEEEAGVTLRRIERIADYYPTPGVCAEHLTSFVGEADLAGSDGTFGLSDEGEDIRTITLPFDRAMTAVADGSVNTAIGLVSLLWLAANRDRLSRDWAGPRGGG